MKFPVSAALVVSMMDAVLAAFVTPRFALNTTTGWTVKGVANGLVRPRSLFFDTAGHLLVVDNGVGILGFTLSKDGSVASGPTVVWSNPDLNHGLTFSVNGKELYTSSNDTVWKFDYNARTFTVKNPQVVVSGMIKGFDTYHNTRTLLIPPKHPHLLVVSRGSLGNIDLPSLDPAVARAAVKVFDLRAIPAGGYDYASGGHMLAYGARNDVGLAADRSGNVWGVENSGDQFTRTKDGVSYDIHIDNPAEKLQNFGDALAATKGGGRNRWFGYPTCFSVWEPSLFPPSDNFTVGDWFTVDDNDSVCSTSVKPALVFPAHVAPLDIKFGPSGDSNAYVSFHGSWNREPPIGYKIVTVPGHVKYNGEWRPSASLNSKTGFSDLLWNPDVNVCPDQCFRPTGLAWSPDFRRLYVSSDASGEIILLARRGH
ncbi:soluble quino protein glucose dehydrogenase [Auricularia subglabra TFB-10046 SS5]|nr:soluble quino protein glucose dehydrogenase [Auricularia subglabra TFB-10046 SS5]